MLPGGTGGGLFGTPQTGLTGLGRGVGLGGGLGASAGGGAGLFSRQSGGLFGNTGTGGLGAATGGGGGGLFGNTPSSQQSNTGLFGGGGLTGGMGGGGTGLFQTPQNALGGQQKATGGLFQSPMLGGSSAGSSVLGGGLFNQTNAGLFKTQTTASGLGQTAGGLGQTAGGLGQTTGGLFGGGTAGVGGLGLTSQGTTTKYEPTKGTDTLSKNGITYNVNTLLHCITAASSYMQKSLEELRFEDYSAGRKGSTTTGGLFGGNQGLALGGGGGLFGQNKGLGAGGMGGVLGNQTQLGGGLGGVTSTGGGIFGNQPKLGGGGGLFGNAPGQMKLGGGLGGGGGLFGGASQAGGGGLLGGGNTGGLFNQSGTGTLGTQNQLGLFNNRAGTGLGGQTVGLGGLGGTAGGLGGTAGGLGGLGAGTTGLGGLGGGGILGNQTSQAGGLGLFNKTSMGTLGGTGIGQNVGGGLNFGGGLGGASGGLNLGAGLNTGLGGNKLGGAGLAGTGQLGLGGSGLGQNLALGQSTLQQQQQEAQLKQQLEILSNSPFGDSQLFRSAIFDASKQQKNKTSPTPVSATKASPTTLQYKLNLRPSAKVKTISLSSPARHKEKSRLFEGLEDSPHNNSPRAGSSTETFVPRKSVKKLNIKPKASQPHAWPDSTTPPTSLEAPSPILPAPSSINSHTVPPTPDVEPLPSSHSGSGTDRTTPTHGSLYSPGGLPPSTNSSGDSLDNTLGLKKPGMRSLTGIPSPIGASPALPPQSKAKKVTVLEPVEEENSLTRSPLRHSPSTNSNRPSQRLCEVVLTDPSYYTVPSLDQCDQMVQQDGSCIVEDFTVGRKDFGEIRFLGKTDVRGLNLDRIVNIEDREVVVYPDDLPDPKPAVGEELNKLSVIQLHGYWPKDKTTGDLIQDPERLDRMNYASKLQGLVTKIGGAFIQYKPESGTCIFKVEHFSKYKLEDSEEEEGGDQQQPGGAKKLKTVQQQPLKQANGIVPPTPQSVPPTVGQTSGPSHQDEDMLTDSPPPPSSEEDKDSASTSVLPAQEIVGARTHHVQIMKASFFNKKDDLSYSIMSPRLHPPLAQSSRPGSRLEERGGLLRSSSSPSAAPSLALSRSMLLQSSLLTSAQPSPSTHFTSYHEEAPPLSEPVDPFSHFHPPLSVSRHPRPVPPMTTSSLQAQSAVLMAKRDLRVLLPAKDGKQRHLCDHSLFLGRSFRVGWGPNWTLAHSGVQVSPAVKQTSPKDGGWSRGRLFLPKDPSPSAEAGGHPIRVVLEQVRVNSSPGICDSFEAFLNVQLTHTTIDEQGPSPLCTPVPGTTLLNALSDVARTNPVSVPPDTAATRKGEGSEVEIQAQLRRVLKLMVVLWGDLPSQCSNDWEDYDNQQARKQRLYRWLKETNRAVTERETAAGTDVEVYLKTLYSLVSGQQLAAACKLAKQKRDHKLACLLSQATYSSYNNKIFLRDQLEKWARRATKTSVQDYLHPIRLKLYVLLAGLMTWDKLSIPSSLATPMERRSTLINTCEGLDWKRSLALHLTFKCGLSSSVSDVLHTYMDGFEGAEGYAPPPHPPYIEARGLSLAPSSPYDTCYHLLQLYCHREHSVELTVQPVASTPHQLDYRISWMVWSLLCALGYTHMSPTATSQLLTSFASQLERSGKWKWAVFVLLHLQDPVLSRCAVQDTLARNCSPSEQLHPSESFVIEKLLVPGEWMFYAKAQRAGSEEWYDVMATHLLSAGKWDEAHRVIMERLAVDAIINEDTDELLNMLEHLSVPERSGQVQSWGCGGSVFLDYLHISNTCRKLSQMPSDLELESLYVGLRQLAARLGQLPSDSPRKVLCQSEMAQRTATFTRAIIQLKAEKGQNVMSEMVGFLHLLPIPPDYAITECRTLLQAHT